MMKDREGVALLAAILAAGDLANDTFDAVASVRRARLLLEETVKQTPESEGWR